MSVITDMVLYIDDDEILAIEEINYWCLKNDAARQQQFEDIDAFHAGGTKYFASYILAMAGNHFPYEKFMEAFWTFSWRNPQKVVLIVNHESDSEFKILTYKDFKNETGSSGSQLDSL